MITTPRVPCLKYLFIFFHLVRKISELRCNGGDCERTRHEKLQIFSESNDTEFFVSLSSAFTQTPSVRTNKPSLQLLPPASESIKLIQEFHRSLLSATEKFSGFVHSLAAKTLSFRKRFACPPSFAASATRNTTRVSIAMSDHGFAAVLPGDSVAGMVVANGLINFLNIYNTVLVVRLVLTCTLCDPYLNIFRGVIPPLGGLDLSPILAFLVLNAVTSSAMALPCELPPAEGAASPSSCETKWMRRRRLSSNKNQTPSSASMN
ncbi:hypothetical protein Bca52824_036468 [Brassica carinata]|uniref:Uncharacterized protein n=1 Tax=Brassica carinata TaxID=52824 RepID=A0A8X7S5L5_BRACI|nr:hypothetical protein Bca52824_036468 [Brassica carinata]